MIDIKGIIIANPIKSIDPEIIDIITIPNILINLLSTIKRSFRKFSKKKIIYSVALDKLKYSINFSFTVQ